MEKDKDIDKCNYCKVPVFVFVTKIVLLVFLFVLSHKYYECLDFLT